jgi:L-ascorbate oxidase
MEKQILAVNDQYPSPTICAVEGDTVVVRVTNHTPTEGVVFH